MRWKKKKKPKVMQNGRPNPAPSLSLLRVGMFPTPGVGSRAVNGPVMERRGKTPCCHSIIKNVHETGRESKRHHYLLLSHAIHCPPASGKDGHARCVSTSHTDETACWSGSLSPTGPYQKGQSRHGQPAPQSPHCRLPRPPRR